MKRETFEEEDTKIHSFCWESMATLSLSKSHRGVQRAYVLG
jgi:hypothetical protein